MKVYCEITAEQYKDPEAKQAAEASVRQYICKEYISLKTFTLVMDWVIEDDKATVTGWVDAM